MIDDGGQWEQQRVLWDVGASFVGADPPDLAAVVTDGIEKISRVVGAASGGIWQTDLEAGTSFLSYRWVRSEGLDMGAGAKNSLDDGLTKRLLDGGGVIFLSLDDLLGTEVVEDHGWTGGTAAIVVIEFDGTSATTLVVGALDVDWGDNEIVLFRGFGTLLRQFFARIRIQEELSYRIRLDDLVVSSVGRLVEATAESWDTTLDRILCDIQSVLGSATISYAVATEQSITVERVHGRAFPDSSDEIEIDPEQKVSELFGLESGRPEPRLLSQRELVVALHGAEVADALGVGEDHGSVGIFPAALHTTTQAVVAVFRDNEGWIPDEVDAVNTIMSSLAQTRARFDAEASSRFWIETDEVVARLVADFLRVDAAEVDAIVEDSLAMVGRHLGASVVHLAEMEPGSGSRLAAEWAPTCGPILEVGTLMPPSAQGDPHTVDRDGSVTARVVRRGGDVSPSSEAMLAASPTGIWTVVACPITVAGIHVGIASFSWFDDESDRLELYTRMVSAFSDLLGQLKTRIQLERKTQRQVAAQDLLRRAAVQLADVDEREFSSALASVLGAVSDFLELEGIANWRIDNLEQRYRLRMRPDGTLIGPGEDAPEFAFGSADLMDRARDALSAMRIEENGDGTRTVTLIQARGTGASPRALLVARRVANDHEDAESQFVLGALSQVIEQIEDRLVAEQYSLSAFGQAPTGIALRDAQLRLVTCNEAFVQFLHAESIEELVGTLPEDVFDIEVDKIEWETEGDVLHAEAPFQARDGRRVWGRIRASRIEGFITGEPLFLIHTEDITTRRRAEQLLRFQATHDELTALANRRSLLESIDQASARGEDLAVLLLDLDRFKLINDSLGHDRGDELLVVIADRLRLTVRPGDLVARLGGDEFAVMLPQPVDEFLARRVADRLLSIIGEPVYLGRQQIFPSASIGIAFAEANTDTRDLIRRADTAMYRAKADGRGRHAVFDERLREEVTARMATESGLRRALRNKELLVHFQPEVSLHDKSILGAEALVRWQHPDEGLLAAGLFVPVAEETGLIVEIGTHVLLNACHEAATWPGGDAGPMLRVNFAAAQLQRDETVALVRLALEQTGLPAHRLCVEITESAVMTDIPRSEDILHRLKELGVKIAVDDFGTGFSSLAYLKRFPVDALKIDRAFVMDLAENGEDQAFVRSIISLADALGLDVVAEGVETQEQADVLLRLGCHRAQGYFFGRPAPAEDLRTRLNERGLRTRTFQP